MVAAAAVLSFVSQNNNNEYDCTTRDTAREQYTYSARDTIELYYITLFVPIGN